MATVLWTSGKYRLVRHTPVSYELLGPCSGEITARDGFVDMGSLMFQPVPAGILGRIHRSIPGEVI